MKKREGKHVQRKSCGVSTFTASGRHSQETSKQAIKTSKQADFFDGKQKPTVREAGTTAAGESEQDSQIIPDEHMVMVMAPVITAEVLD